MGDRPRAGIPPHTAKTILKVFVFALNDVVKLQLCFLSLLLYFARIFIY